MPQDVMQHDTRQNYVFRDQHGREYLANVDTRTKPHLSWCTPLQPRFDAPIMPYGHLLKPDPSWLGQIVVDYRQWEDEAVSQWASFLQHQAQTAERMFKDDAQRAIDERDPRLAAEVGYPPMHPDFVRAAAGGESLWVLGLAKDMTKVPSWAEPLLYTLPQYRPALVPTTVGGGRFADDATDHATDDEGDDETSEPAKRGRGRPRKLAEV